MLRGRKSRFDGSLLTFQILYLAQNESKGPKGLRFGLNSLKGNTKVHADIVSKTMTGLTTSSLGLL